MATKKKKKTKNQFKAGNQASKGFGRPKMTDDEKALRLKNRTEWKALLDMYMTKSPDELKKLKKDKTLPAIDHMVIQSILNAAESGGNQTINWHLDHSLGKPKEVSHINLSGGTDNTNTIKAGDLTKEELLAIKKIQERKNGQT